MDEKFTYKVIHLTKTIKLIILYEDLTTGKIRMTSPDIFREKKMIDHTTSDDLANVFVKKYTNLHGFEFKVAHIDEPGRSILKDGQIIGIDGNYLDTIMDALNATYKITKTYDTGENIRLLADFASGTIDSNFNEQHS
jgi:hypothetical protein